MYLQVDFNGIRARSEAEQRREREREERQQRINKERINKVLKEIEGKLRRFFFYSIILNDLYLKNKCITKLSFHIV